jgi:DNA-binding XRE family transcriptional regulator
VLADDRRLGARGDQRSIWQVARIVALLDGAPMDHPVTFAGRLLVIRRRLGLTQAELAAQLGEDEKEVSRREAGGRTPHHAIAGRFDRALRGLKRRPCALLNLDDAG